jgi:hypothetical protein
VVEVLLWLVELEELLSLELVEELSVLLPQPTSIAISITATKMIDSVFFIFLTPSH